MRRPLDEGLELPHLLGAATMVHTLVVSSHHEAMIVSVHDSAVDPCPRRCLGVTPCAETGDATSACIRVTVGIGTFEQVHHVEIRETADDVIVTAFVGIAPEARRRSGAEGGAVYTMQRLHWAREFALSSPLGQRSIRDGASTNESQG